MNDIQSGSNDYSDEKEILSLLSSMDDDLADKLIDELLNEKGECVNLDNIKEKALSKLEKSEKKRKFGKRAFIAVSAAALLTVSTVYASEIQEAVRSFFGKSVVYNTVVDGDAYYLPEEIALDAKYSLKSANMSEGRLVMTIGSDAEMSDDWYSKLNVSVAAGGESYTTGGYMFGKDGLFMAFYEVKPFKDFELSLDGNTYNVSLVKAESLKVDESLAIGVPKAAQKEEDVDGEPASEAVEALPLIANVAASRTDGANGVGIRLVAGFDDPDLKLSAFGVEADLDSRFNRMFENIGEGAISSSSGPNTKPLIAYDGDGNEYILEIPEDVKSWPVTTFETNAVPGTKLTVKVPAIEVNYEKEVDNIRLSIPETGEAEVNKEVDFIIQKAVIKSIKRTSETTAEILFDLNTGADKSVKILDISAYSPDVTKGETVVANNEAVLKLTFDKGITEANFEFTWPHFIINGNWSIELD